MLRERREIGAPAQRLNTPATVSGA